MTDDRRDFITCSKCQERVYAQQNSGRAWHFWPVDCPCCGASLFKVTRNREKLEQREA